MRKPNSLKFFQPKSIYSPFKYIQKNMFLKNDDEDTKAHTTFNFAHNL